MEEGVKLGVKVFCATKHNERENLGTPITKWLTAQQKEYGDKFLIKDTIVKQSSDSEYHCLSIIFLYGIHL